MTYVFDTVQAKGDEKDGNIGHGEEYRRPQTLFSSIFVFKFFWGVANLAIPSLSSKVIIKLSQTAFLAEGSQSKGEQRCRRVFSVFFDRLP